MSSVDHLHAEANVLKVREHSELLSAQYLARCLEPENVNNSITTRDPPKSRMKETLFTRHRSTVEPNICGHWTSGSCESSMSIFGWVLAWCGFGLNNVTVDFGAEINKMLSLSGPKALLFLALDCSPH